MGRITIRMSDEVDEKVHEILEITDDKYYNISHVVRCAIMKLHREETMENGKTTIKPTNREGQTRPT